MENGLQALLSEPLGSGIHTVAIPGGKNIAQVHPGVMELDIAQIAHASEIEGALLRGEMVPAVVTEGYPEVVDFIIDLAMEVDASL